MVKRDFIKSSPGVLPTKTISEDEEFVIFIPEDLSINAVHDRNSIKAKYDFNKLIYLGFY